LRLIGATILLWLFPTLASSLPAAVLPEGFHETRVASGINGATAMEIAPDGRLFVCEQTGALRVVKDDRLLPTPCLNVTVDSTWERGLLGVAFDPLFTQNHFIYVNYTAPTPYPHHRISRFTADSDVAVANSEVILLEGDDQNTLGGGVKNGHQGGAIHFGKDGKLYIAIGDQTAGAPAQDLKTFQGKILRINGDGTIPSDNPFYHSTEGKYRAIWALGLRNPFTFAIQPGTGRMFINDVGGAHEEINEGVAGANFGWPTVDHGPTSDPRFRGPIHSYKESSITGGAFYDPPVRQFPGEYVGKYFFADFKAGWMKTLDPDRPADVKDFATGFGQWGVLDIKIASDGSLYYLSRNAWVRDKDFQPNRGSLYKVRYTGERTPPYLTADLAGQTVRVGEAATFRVAAAGSATLHFQWLRNDAAIPGAISGTYTLPSVARADNGAKIRCLVSNAFGNVASDWVTLTVRARRRETALATFGDLSLRPRPGNYTGPVTIQLASLTANATLQYTTDGSDPTSSSPRYTEPFRLERTSTLKVQTFRNGLAEGKPVIVTYAIHGATSYGLSYLRPASTVQRPRTPEQAPPLLSQTGIFASLQELAPNPGIIPYDVISPLWSDGAEKRRWLVPVPGGTIQFSATGEWAFPAGTVFVKHFELPIDDTNPHIAKRLETRLLVVDGTGNGFGLTYKWRPDNSDADLLANNLSETLSIKTPSGGRTQTWYYPSRADCLTCHTTSAKFVLGVKTRQLNRDYIYPNTGITDNQLRTWNYLGLLSPGLREDGIPHYPHLAALDDARANVEERARSYIDANCAHCHRPGNTLRATFDARYDTPLSDQVLVNAATVSDSLSVVDPRVIAPRDPLRSMLLLRMKRSDNYRMPPLAMSVHDESALGLLQQWIESLPPTPVR
jgi:uncharacterized repeat protein (TIGR03806 family)